MAIAKIGEDDHGRKAITIYDNNGGEVTVTSFELSEALQAGLGEDDLQSLIENLCDA